MDSRHESLIQGLINHFIIVINAYIESNTDTLVENHPLQKSFHDICSHIYYYTGTNVDIDGILSRHNLLSIDVVLFPVISDPEINTILNKADFAKLIDTLEKNVDKLNATSSIDNVLKKDLSDALDQCKSEMNL